MTTALLDMISDVLKEIQTRSWHETARRDLGLTDETDGEALLALTIERSDKKSRPLAFVIDGEQVNNTILAMGEYLREVLHPLTGAVGAIAVMDFLPPLDSEGHARGTTRRWVLDRTNHMVVLPELTKFLKAVARGL